MSRAVRFAAADRLLAVLVAALVWRLAAPDDTRGPLAAGRQAGARHSRLPPLLPGKPAWPRATLVTGKPRLVNIFASWCVPCIAEAPVLDAARSAAASPIDGIAIRDRPEDVADFLAATATRSTAIGADTRQPGPARARLVGRARKLRRRWPRHHPLPAYRPDRAGRRADDPRRAGEGAVRRCSCSCLRCSLAQPALADSNRCRRPIGPTASCPTRARKRGRRR